MVSRTRILVGSGLAGLGLLDPNPKRGLGFLLGGAGVLAWDLVPAITQTVKEAKNFAESGAYETTGYSPLPGMEIGATIESTGAALFRIVSTETGVSKETVGAYVTPGGGADPAAGAQLGKPKNLALIAGRIVDPSEGSRKRSAIGSTTYPIHVAVENQNNKEQTGRVQLRVSEQLIVGKQVTFGAIEGAVGDAVEETIDLPDVRLSASGRLGSFRELVFRAPVLARTPRQGKVLALGLFEGLTEAEVTAKLYWNGHLLDRATFTRLNPFL